MHYRAGGLSLTATGTLVADSGRSIFLEERLEHQGRKKQFRWEIPYSSILRIVVTLKGSTPVPVSLPKPVRKLDEEREPSEARGSGEEQHILPRASRPQEG